MYDITAKYNEAFALTDAELGHANLAVHAVNTGAALPIQARYRPQAFSKLDYPEEELAKLQRLGIVAPAEPGQCQGSSAAVTLRNGEPVAHRKVAVSASCTFFIDRVAGEDDVVYDALSRVLWGEEGKRTGPAAEPYRRLRFALKQIREQ